MSTALDTRIYDRLNAVRLPPIPQILAQLLELSRQDDAGLTELAALIRRDPAMTVRILEIASGPMYRRGQGILSLEQSLMTIGMNMVKTILISEAILNAFDDIPTLSGYDLRPFWAHSLTAAVAARAIAAQLGYARTEEAYLAGLLHDVGRLALLGAAPTEYARHFFGPEDDTLAGSEKLFLGITHGEAGAWVAERWHFDSFIADSIRYHHESSVKLQAPHPLLRIVALADQLATRPHNDASLVAAIKLCSLRGDQLELIKQAVSVEVGKLGGHVGFDLAAVDVDPARMSVSQRRAEPAQAAISAHMQDMVLASELTRSFGALDETTSIYDALTRSVCLLFGLTQAALFTVDKAERSLRSTGDDAAAMMLSELNMPLTAQGRITDALLRKQVAFLSKNDSNASIFEEQLCRLLDTQTLVIVPIAQGDIYSGVIIAGVNDAWLGAVRRRTKLLRIFGEHANKALIQPLRTEAGKLQDVETAIEEYRNAARAVAHEVNNPLSIIRNYLSVLHRKISLKEPVDAEIGILQDEIDRITQLVESFADLQPIARGKVANLTEALTDVVNLLRDAEIAPSTMQIALHGFEPRTTVACDYGTLKQVFINLLKNAVEALAGTGRIDVTYHGVAPQDTRMFASLTIKDSGPGIPDDVMAHLFTPVRTQKGGNHKGIGLSIVHDLVTKTGGQIHCNSATGIGTLFNLLLPLAASIHQPGTSAR